MDSAMKKLLSAIRFDYNGGKKKDKVHKAESEKLLRDGERKEERENDEHEGKWERFLKAVAKRLKKDGLRFILLVIFNGFYLYLGGLIFFALENSPKLTVDYRKHVEELLTVFKEHNVDLEAAKKIGLSKFVAQNITQDTVNAVSVKLERIHQEMKDSEKPEWSVTRAVFLASTIVTTIGYGNMAPATTAGRWFCVVYAIIGIPLNLMLLALVGRILSKYINKICSWIVMTLKKHLYSDYQYDKVDEDLKSPAWLALLLITIFISLDAFLFMAMEGWSFAKSLYFIFITLTTIGFGDIVPGNDSAVWFNVTLLYVGLAAVSITINLLVANLSLQYRRHKEKINLVKKIDEELQESESESEEVEGKEEKNSVNGL